SYNRPLPVRCRTLGCIMAQPLHRQAAFSSFLTEAEINALTHRTCSRTSWWHSDLRLAIVFVPQHQSGIKRINYTMHTPDNISFSRKRFHKISRQKTNIGAET
ncbi:MAG: hypothetical protein AAF636_26605, partial [Pseudomonadota bacterium]